MTVEQITGQAGTDAVKELRLEKFRNGLPFMIHSDDLEPRQCYFEFPDGVIRLAHSKEGTRKFTMIRKLSEAEAKALRVKCGFYRT